MIRKLISAQEVIAWLGITERMFRRRYMVHPDWPVAVTPPRIAFTDRRWYQDEVERAIEQMRKNWRKAA